MSPSISSDISVCGRKTRRSASRESSSASITGVEPSGT
jgi:hypothetical protein